MEYREQMKNIFSVETFMKLYVWSKDSATEIR